MANPREPIFPPPDAANLRPLRTRNPTPTNEDAIGDPNFGIPGGVPGRGGQTSDLPPRASREDTLDTGVGGFVIEPGDAPEGKDGIYTYDVGDPNRENIAGYPTRPPELHGGRVNVDNSVKDISKDTKRTLAHYIGVKSNVNRYSVDGDYREVSIKGTNNVVPSLPPQDKPTTNSEFFTKGTPYGASNVVPQSYENDNKLWKMRTPPEEAVEIVLPVVVKKGKQITYAPATARDGNSLLAENPAENPSLTRYRNAALSNNRFAKAAENFSHGKSGTGVLDGFEADGFTKKKSTKQTDTGASFTEADEGENKHFNPVLYSPKYGEVTLGRLAQIGTALSLRASGEFTDASEAANDPNVVQTSWLAKQITAQKINLTELDVDRVIKELSEKDLRDVFYTSISDNSSWGNINNSLIQYSGWSSMAMAALAIAMSAGISVILNIFFNLFQSQTSENKFSTPGLERYPLGSSIEEGDTSDQVLRYFSSLIGMNRTVFEYSDCVARGNSIFFGLGSTSDFLRVGLLKTIQSSGQVIIMSKAIVRSSVLIFDRFADAFMPGLGGLNIDRIIRLLNALEYIGQSKLMGALNMFATIGDASFISEYYAEKRKNSVSESGAGYIHESRLPGYQNKLPWASNRAPALYLLPNRLDKFASNMRNANMPGSPAEAGGADQRIEDANTSNDNPRPAESRKDYDSGLRVTPEALEQLERKLDSEYMPFYFHDVRTNEIISFHAFLESLSDDFSASYDTVDGIGRVEPVKIYKGTQRKISMSFFVAATSNRDFEDMWEKINKLVTLVYPQYTAGRRHKVGENYEFVQPFSQIVGAAPLIRIRLGNLLRSNYSKFALARLFGAEQENVRFGLSQAQRDEIEKIKDAGRTSLAEVETVQQREQKQLQNMQGTFSVKQGEIVASRRKQSTAEIPLFPKIIKLPFAAEVSVLEKITLKTRDRGSIERCVVKFVKPIDVQGKEDFFKNIGSDEYLLDDVNRKYLVNPDALEITPEMRKSFVEQEKAERLEAMNKTEAEIKKYKDALLTNIDGLSRFMDENNNAVVKSFKSAAGQGLAGFIESMNFDWYSQVMWDVDPGQKAPKMCKVSISFSPIHDISPGLDHQGYNRAPVYSGIAKATKPPGIF